MRSPSLTLSHGTLSPTLTDTDKSARVRKRSTEAGANSSKLRTRNLVHDGRLSTLVAGVEERAAAMRPESRRKTHGEVMSASARLRRQLQNRARAGAASPRTLGTSGAQRQTSTRQIQTGTIICRPPARPERPCWPSFTCRAAAISAGVQ